MNIKDLIEKLQKFEPEAVILYKSDFNSEEIFLGAEVHQLTEKRVLMALIKEDNF